LFFVSGDSGKSQWCEGQAKSEQHLLHDSSPKAARKVCLRLCFHLLSSHDIVRNDEALWASSLIGRFILSGGITVNTGEERFSSRQSELVPGKRDFSNQQVGRLQEPFSWGVGPPAHTRALPRSFALALAPAIRPTQQPRPSATTNWTPRGLMTSPKNMFVGKRSLCFSDDGLPGVNLKGFDCCDYFTGLMSGSFQVLCANLPLFSVQVQ
jgi:hypothetical protein